MPRKPDYGIGVRELPHGAREIRYQRELSRVGSRRAADRHSRIREANLGLQFADCLSAITHDQQSMQCCGSMPVQLQDLPWYFEDWATHMMTNL
jgi:hypothetical protein